MTDNTELQRLMRLRRLGSQIAASLPSDLDHEQAFQVHGYVRESLERRHDRTLLPARLRRSGAYDAS
jgi:hypothetical protein